MTMRPVDTTTTLYSRAPGAGESTLDFIVWYQAHAG